MAASGALAGPLPTVRPLLGWLVLWLGLWFGPGLMAAAHLLQVAKSPPLGVALHAALLAALWLAAWLPVLPDLLRGSLGPRRGWALAGLLGTLQAGLFAFYGLNALGQRFWGDWLNADLLVAYAPQAPELLRALDIEPLAVAAGLGAGWLGLVGLQRGLLGPLLQQRARWPACPPGLGLGLTLATVAALALFYLSYVREVAHWWQEPLRQASRSGGFGEAGAGPQFSPEQLRQENAATAAYRPGPLAGRARPLVLVIVDALRSDQMGVYGAPVANTPFLSSLAQAGHLQRVDNAYSVCTVSYCGILGTLSSKPWHRITPQPWNIADALQRLGYESRFLLSGDHTSYFGMRRMYGTAVGLMHDGSDQRRHYVNDDRLVLQALDETGWPRDKPGFLYVHLMSVHRLGRVDEAYRRWSAANAPAFSAFAPLDPGQNAALRARYHNGILQADDMIRQLFERLARLKVLDDAVVVITADHGEALGEHGQTSHGHAPLEPLVRIPLLVHDRQARAPFPPRALVSQTDVAPTLLQAVGAAAPANWTGTALQQPLAREALALESADTTAVVAQRAGRRLKYLRQRDTGAEQLFDLAPGAGGEGRNLAAEPAEAGWLAQMRLLHQRLLPQTSPAGPPAVALARP